MFWFFINSYTKLDFLYFLNSFIPEIKQFWNEVEHYREVGIIEDKPKRKDKRKKEEEYDLNCGCML